MILITGNKGFLGKKLQPLLGECLTVDLMEGTNLITSPLPKNVDIIYHFAAQTSVEASWNDPVHDMDNLRMTARLVKEYPDAKIIFAQSAAAEEPSSSPYGFSKWASGEYLKRFHKNSVICVFPNVYGGGKGVVDIFKGQEEVTIFGDGEQVRDFVHADDIIEGLLKAQNWAMGTYYMGSGKGTTINALATGKRIVRAPARVEIRESILPNTTPDWKPEIDVIDYIK
jgi:nucleoside-diphosphate-sugar epimerase